jgi:hypothetical protein
MLLAGRGDEKYAAYWNGLKSSRLPMSISCALVLV